MIEMAKEEILEKVKEIMNAPPAATKG